MNAEAFKFREFLRAAALKISVGGFRFGHACKSLNLWLLRSEMNVGAFNFFVIERPRSGFRLRLNATKRLNLSLMTFSF